jgi:hypothetical protein
MLMDILKGIPQIFGDGVLRLLLGTNSHEVLNAEDATGDYAETDETTGIRNGRVIYVDVAGIMKFTYYDDAAGVDKTEVMYMNAGQLYQIRRAYKAYKVYVGATACTAKIYTDAGALKIGVKIRR